MQILCRTASHRSHAASHSRLSPEGTRIYQTPHCKLRRSAACSGGRDGDENFMSDNKKQMMDIQKVKSFSVAVSDEHQRNWGDNIFSRKENDPKYNYDRSRTRLNFLMSCRRIPPTLKQETGKLKPILRKQLFHTSNR